MHKGFDFNEKPILVFWETTKACKLACKHCRAQAIEKPLPDELTHEEGLKLIDQITEFGRPYPHLVLTGGDPLMRPDFWDLVKYSVSKGIRTLIAPSVTPLLTDDVIERFRKEGIVGASVSLDGTEKTHNSIRGYPWVYKRTIDVIRKMKEVGLFVQINTTVMKPTVMDLPKVFKTISDLGVDAWEVFFLIPTGRATFQLDLSPQEYWDVVNFLYDAAKYKKMTIRTTEAPFYRVVFYIRSRMDEVGEDVSKLGVGKLYWKLREELERLMGPIPKEPIARKAPSAYTRDGYGVIFVAYNGDVYPSGFLPYKVGNVREESLVKIYRESEALRKIRDVRSFKGPCGKCEFAEMCGGSRARAYAYYNDPFASDPACYFPQVREVAKQWITSSQP